MAQPHDTPRAPGSEPPATPGDVLVDPAAVDAGEQVEWFNLEDLGLTPEELAADREGFALANAIPLAPSYAPPPEITSVKQRGFLVAYAVNGANVTRAAKAAGVHRRTHYEWLESPVYEEAFKDAHAAAVEWLEAEVHRRAVIGWVEPIFGKDGMVGVKRKFSDTLLAMRARALAPDRYGDKAGTAVQVNVDMRTQVEVRDTARDRILAHARQLDLAAEPIEVQVVEGDAELELEPGGDA